MNTTITSIPKLTRIASLVRRHPDAFTEHQIRAYVRDSRRNGLDEARAVIRRGRSVFLDETRFFSWLESHQGDVRHGEEEN